MRRVFALLTVSTVFALIGGIVVAAPALAAPVKISEDPYTNPESQHKTEVEPDNFAFGRTIVATFQVGRIFGGGAANNGWATSTDGGATWTNGFLPGTTVHATPPGIYDRFTDPAVAYDPKHQVWMISSLGLKIASGVNDVLTSRSTDGGLTWGNPVMTAAGDAISFYDKNWITCDTSPTSPFYGNCYTEWDDNGRGNLMLMSTSTDGGLTWGPPKQTANHETGGIGGQPVVLANGTVVVPFDGNTGIKAFTSTDGGNTWSTPVTVASVFHHQVAGGLRAPTLPSAEVRIPGPVIVTWSDCRFEPGCSANDIVMSTSTNGVNWSPVRRIPLDPIGSGVDHFLPGVAFQGQTLTASAAPHIALGYYYYPVAACLPATCQLHVGFSFSADGGGSWSPPQTLAGPMMLSWLANTSQGRMVGDYMSTAYAGENAFPVYASATAPINMVFQEHMFTSQQPAATFVGPTLRASSAGAIYGRPSIVEADATAN